MDLKKKRILITGANGFIGGRLAERLSDEESARVRAMARTPVGARHSQKQLSNSNASSQKPSDLPFRHDVANASPSQVDTHSQNPVSKLHVPSQIPIELTLKNAGANASPLQSAEICIGDITDPVAVKRAVDGCDVVVHCAALQSGRAKLDEFRRVNVGGTLNLLRAARDANVTRFIHISTMNVHGYPPPNDANADSPLSFNGDFYSISKAEAERAVWEFSRNYHFPIAIIRPGCTYGPRATAWTLVPLRRVRRGSLVLIGKGDGICNAVYIDNLIDLILLALKSDDAIGQAFIGAEGRGVSWRDFYGAYARMLGVSHLRSLPYGVAIAIATASELAFRITGRAPFVSRQSIDFYSHKIVYDVEKSRKLLGYEPRVSFEQGMAKTYEWLVSSGELSAMV